MKTNCLLILLLICIFHTSQAQSNYSILVNSGYTFNQKITLKGENVDISKGYLVNVGFSYKAFSPKRIFAEIGLSGKMIFATGKTVNHSFKSTTFRLSMPTKFVFPIKDEKWLIVTGIILQNNVDFREFDFRLRDKYAWRMDGLLEVRYLLKKGTYLTLGFNRNLRNIPDPYFINDPKTAFLIGIQRVLRFKSSKKTPILHG